MNIIPMSQKITFVFITRDYAYFTMQYLQFLVFQEYYYSSTLIAQFSLFKIVHFIVRILLYLIFQFLKYGKIKDKRLLKNR